MNKLKKQIGREIVMNRLSAILGSLAFAVLLTGTTQATTIGFVGAAGVNQDIPENYGSNILADGTGWTVTDGTGATPHIALDWGNSTGWIWEFHNAITFQHLEALHAGGAWDAVAPPNTNAVAQLQDQNPNGGLELNFSVIPGVKLVLNSLDIGNATDQTGSEGPYGFDLALIKNSNSSVVWTHHTPEFNAGEQQSVSINYTGDLGEDYTLTFTRHGLGSGVTFRSGIDNLSFSEVLTPAAPQFKLTVDRSNGGLTLTNIGATATTIKGYSITSEAGALNYSGWKAISGNYDVNGNASVDPNDDWTKLSQAGDSNELTEYEFGGDGATIGAASSVVLNQAGGNAWVKSPFEELALDIVLADGNIYSYSVEYINGPVGGYAVGDLNFDGAVNALDWPAYNAGRGVDMTGMSTVEAYLLGDLDGDFDNDISDFVLFKGLVTGGGQAASQAVPEPLTTSLLLVACGVLFVRRPAKPDFHRESTCRRRNPVTASTKIVSSAFVLLAAVVGTAGATTIGFVGAAAVNADLPVNYGSNLSADGTGWTVSDGTGTTPNISLYWGGAPASTGWDWEFHNAVTFQHLEALHAGGTWDALAPPGTNAVAQLQHQDTAPHEIKFSVLSGANLVLHSFDIGNATDQLASEGPYGFDIALIRDSDSSQVWTHHTPEFNAGEQESVAVNYTGGLGESYTLRFTRHGQGTPPLRTWRSGLDNLSFSEGAVAAPLKLIVNTLNGAVTLANDSSSSFDIDSYEIHSASESLDPIGWNSLQDQDYEGNGAPGTGNGWEEAGGVGAGQLIESYLLGSSVLSHGASISLGQAFEFDKIGVQQDLEFGYHVAGEGGALHAGVVEYVQIAVDGDYNHNGIVDAADYVVWRKTLGQSGPALPADGDGNGTVQEADYTYWRTRFGNISGSGSGGVGAAAVPEPGTLSLLGLLAIALVLGSRCYDKRARGINGGSLPWITALAAILTVTQSALAAKTNDRRYEFGDGGTSNTQDSQFISADDKQDLAVGTGSGSPVFVDVSSTGLNRPGAATGDKGAQFDGSNDVLFGVPLNRPDETAGPGFVGNGPLLFPFPYNYDTITTRGLQMWVYPDASAIGTGRQGIVFDTREAGGVSISADGKWTQSFDGVVTDGPIGAAVPVVGNQWYHVMHHIYYWNQPGFPEPLSNASTYTGVVYVNGVAVSASNGNVSPGQLDDGDRIGVLAVGAEETASIDLVNPEFTNYFKGVVDDLEMYVYGDNSSEVGPPAGQNYGTFNLFSDNAWIAAQTAAIPGGVLKSGDVTRDGNVNQADVAAFVAGWRMEKKFQGALNQMYVGDWETWGWGDLNLDGVVNLHDAIILDQELMAGTGSGLDFSLLNGSSTPEPGALILACLGMMTLAFHRSTRKTSARVNTYPDTI